MTTEQHDEPAPVKTMWVVLAALLIPVIILGVYWYTSQVTTEQYVYNGFVFTQIPCEVGECWQTTVISNVGEHPVLFFYGPQELEDITIEPEAIERVLNLTRMANSSLRIGFDQGVPGEIAIAATNIARVTGERFYRIPTTGGVYGEDFTCSSASRARPILYLTQDAQTGAYLQDDCVYLTATNTSEAVRVSDAYTLHLLQIMR